jgi:hypothetical protein
MDRKIVTGIIVLTGVLIIYHLLNKKKSKSNDSVSVESNSTNNNSDLDKSISNELVSEKDAVDFYTKMLSDGNWKLSKEGTGRFLKLYLENMTKSKHFEVMKVLNIPKEKRNSEQNKIIQDAFNSIFSKLK